MTDTQLPRWRFWGNRQPSNKAVPLQVLNAADAKTTKDETVATLRMYGPIDSWGGFWGISAKEVAAALDELPETIEDIILRVNSPGGEAWEGMAILNLLRAHPAKVLAVVDGMAASAASFIAAGCDDTIMSPGSQMMIHDASGFAYGNSATMAKAQRMLDSTSNSIAAVYAAAAGGTDESWRQLMRDETWYTAQEAVAAGLAASVQVVPDAGQTDTAGAEPPPDPEVPDEGDIEDAFDLSMYRYAGRSHAPAPAALGTPKPPTASAGGSTHPTEGGPAVAFSDEQITDMRRTLGIAEDADEATILAALTEALDERSDPTTDTVPDGHVVIPAARLADLEAGAKAGVQAATTLREQERERFLNDNRTKYAPANRDAWAKEYDRDPEGTRKHFESAADIIPLAELGQAGDTDTSEDDALYASVFGKDA